MDLNAIWFLLVGILVIVYAILDGFDLGVGSLYFLLAKTKEEKRLLTNAVGPVWDGNEVWLLTGGGALFAAFPLVYAASFSAFYLALLLVLYALIARAISIEYKEKVEDSKLRNVLDWAFCLGSLIPALLYGVAMGNVARGIPLNTAQNYTGSFFGLLNPYALLLGLTGLAAFLLQGAMYISFKTDGQTARRAQTASSKIWLGFGILYLLSSLASLAVAPRLFNNYLQYPVLFLIPLASWAAFITTRVMIRQKSFFGAFLASSTTFAAMILTLALGLFPVLLPAQDPALSLTIYNASSSPLTLKTMLIIVLIGLPFVLAYTIYAYRVFHGKVTVEQDGY